MPLVSEALRAFITLYRQEWPDVFRYYSDVETIRQFLTARTGREHTTKEAMHYATLNINMDWNPNTGICYLAAKFIQAYLKDVHDITINLAYIHVRGSARFGDNELEPRNLFYHCILEYEGRYYDTLLPDGVDDWRLMFSGHHPTANLQTDDPVNYVLHEGKFPYSFFDQRLRNGYYPKDHPAEHFYRAFPRTTA